LLLFDFKLLLFVFAFGVELFGYLLRLPKMKLPVNEDVTSSSNVIERNVDFSDYMWMGEEMEEFDSKCILELYEEDFIESCFEELFAEEEQFAEEMEMYLSNLTQEQIGNLVCQLDAVSIGVQTSSAAATASQKDVVLEGIDCQLNPNAPVFVPSSTKADDDGSGDVSPH
jgi:hypothetical protein